MCALLVRVQSQAWRDWWIGGRVVIGGERSLVVNRARAGCCYAGPIMGHGAAHKQYREITRRSAVGLMAAAGLGYMVWPIGARRGSELAHGRVVVRYWEKWTGHEGLAMRDVVDAFNASQDRIFVEYLTISGIDVKGMLAIGGGDPPDVMGGWSYSLPAFVENDAFMPLDEFAGASSIGEHLYTPAVWSLLTHGGRQWAGVNTASSIGLYYNRTMFREVGLDPDRPPRTIAELDEYSDRLTVRRGDGSIKRSGFLPKEPGWNPGLWPYMFGGSLFDEEKGAVSADLAANITAMEWVQSFPKRYGGAMVHSFASGFGSYSSPQDAFLSGKVAMVVQGPWIVNNIKAFRPGLDYGAGPLPVLESMVDESRPMGMVECDMLVIPRGCPHPEEAWEFVRFTQLPWVQEQLSLVHAKPSPFREVSSEFIANHPNRMVGVHTQMLASDRAVVWPRVPVWPFYADEVRRAVDKVWERESMDVGKLMGEVQRRVSAEHTRLTGVLGRQRQARGLSS